jgi:hypothetical protein
LCLMIFWLTLLMGLFHCAWRLLIKVRTFIELGNPTSWEGLIAKLLHFNYSAR